MATIVLDTHQLVNRLKQRGFSEEQAAGITEALQEIDLTQLASKQDLRELELRMTIKLGGLIIAGVAFLSFLKFFG